MKQPYRHPWKGPTWEQYQEKQKALRKPGENPKGIVTKKEPLKDEKKDERMHP